MTVTFVSIGDTAVNKVEENPFPCRAYILTRENRYEVNSKMYSITDGGKFHGQK